MKTFNLEDLVANALIIKIESSNSKYVSFSEIETYRKNIKAKFLSLGEEIRCDWSKGDLERLEDCYGNFFEVKEDLFFLKKDRRNIDLTMYFRSYLSLEVDKVFHDAEIVKCLLK